MRPRIHIEDHALLRMIERGCERNLDLQDMQMRVLETVAARNESSTKHISEKHKTFVKYFPDGLCFYVVCVGYNSDGEQEYRIKTVIIEEGRP